MATEWQWGERRMVDPRVIVIDHRFQREQKKDVIEAIASNPDPRAFGIPIVFERDNKVLYCADGQQRIMGVLNSPEPPRRIPVEVFQLDSIKDEAEVFWLINVFRKSLTPHEKHKGGLVAEHPANVAIERVVSELGLSIGPTRSPKQIGAISALHQVYNRSGEETLRDTVLLASRSWPDDARAFDTLILRSLGRLVAEYKANGIYDRQKMQDGLAKTSPVKIQKKAEEVAYDTGKTKAESCFRAIRLTTKL